MDNPLKRTSSQASLVDTNRAIKRMRTVSGQLEEREVTVETSSDATFIQKIRETVKELFGKLVDLVCYGTDESQIESGLEEVINLLDKDIINACVEKQDIYTLDDLEKTCIIAQKAVNQSGYIDCHKIRLSKYLRRQIERIQDKKVEVARQLLNQPIRPEELYKLLDLEEILTSTKTSVLSRGLSDEVFSRKGRVHYIEKYDKNVELSKPIEQLITQAKEKKEAMFQRYPLARDYVTALERMRQKGVTEENLLGDLEGFSSLVVFLTSYSSKGNQGVSLAEKSLIFTIANKHFEDVMMPYFMKEVDDKNMHKERVLEGAARNLSQKMQTGVNEGRALLSETESDYGRREPKQLFLDGKLVPSPSGDDENSIEKRLKQLEEALTTFMTGLTGEEVTLWERPIQAVVTQTLFEFVNDLKGNVYLFGHELSEEKDPVFKAFDVSNTVFYLDKVVNSEGKLKGIKIRAQVGCRFCYVGSSGEGKTPYGKEFIFEQEMTMFLNEEGKPVFTDESDYKMRLLDVVKEEALQEALEPFVLAETQEEAILEFEKVFALPWKIASNGVNEREEQRVEAEYHKEELDLKVIEAKKVNSIMKDLGRRIIDGTTINGKKLSDLREDGKDVAYESILKLIIQQGCSQEEAEGILWSIAQGGLVETSSILTKLIMDERLMGEMGCPKFMVSHRQKYTKIEVIANREGQENGIFLEEQFDLTAVSLQVEASEQLKTGDLRDEQFYGIITARTQLDLQGNPISHTFSYQRNHKTSTFALDEEQFPLNFN